MAGRSMHTNVVQTEVAQTEPGNSPLENNAKHKMMALFSMIGDYSLPERSHLINNVHTIKHIENRDRL